MRIHKLTQLINHLPIYFSCKPLSTQEEIEKTVEFYVETPADIPICIEYLIEHGHLELDKHGIYSKGKLIPRGY